MKRFKFFRKWKGGVWILFDFAHYGGYSGPEWMQVSESELNVNNIRLIKLEKYENNKNK